MIVVIINRFFAKKFRGLAIYPFIFLKDKQLRNNPLVINHEKIHLRQQIELLWIFFFFWYGIEFLIRWIQFKDSNLAYFNISFEREAYGNEGNLKFLNDRKFWNFTRYL